MTNTSQPITQQQLESYLWGAATLLRGVIDAGDYKQFIFPLLFFKRICDVYDEEYQQALALSGGDVDYAAFAENHRFQVPAGAHWCDVRNRATQVGKALQNAMRAIEQANAQQLTGIFGDAQWTNKERLSDSTLRDMIEHFSSLTLSVANVPEDELGRICKPWHISCYDAGMNRRDLTKDQWARLEPLLPTQKPATGHPNHPHRTVINWRQAGIWDRILASLQAQAHQDGDLDWTFHFVDSTIVRAHQHAAGAKKGGSESEGLGRSQGGVSTRLSVHADGNGKPIAFVL